MRYRSPDTIFPVTPNEKCVQFPGPVGPDVLHSCVLGHLDGSKPCFLLYQHQQLCRRRAFPAVLGPDYHSTDSKMSLTRRCGLNKSSSWTKFSTAIQRHHLNWGNGPANRVHEGSNINAVPVEDPPPGE